MTENSAYQRHLEASLEGALADTPVVVLQGARQVGKSTLATAVGTRRNARMLSLDDPGTRATAEEDAAHLVAQGAEGTLVIDEAQRSPGIILPLKASVDRDRRPGRFLLTGSADLLQVKGVGDSLAGRAETFELLPLSQGELARRSAPEDFVTWLLSGPPIRDYEQLDPAAVIRGGYPEVQTRKAKRVTAWFESYAARLSDHDARDLHSGGYADKLGNLLHILAAGGQQELVTAGLARDLDVAQNTAEAYLRAATVMRLVSSLSPWGRNLRGRATKRSKVSLNDTGFAAALVGFTTDHADQIGGREYFGALVEQFVALELEKQRGWSDKSYRMYHYRDTDGLEVDIIIELADGRLIAIEVKSALQVTGKAWRGLERFKERFSDRDVTGVCFYAGEQSWRLHDWLHVLPITALWQH